MTFDRGDLWSKVLNHFNGNTQKAALWFATPNPLLGNIAPDVMIAAGRKDKVRQFIEDSIKENMTANLKKASVLQDVPTYTTAGTITTDKSEKVDFRPGCFCDSCIAIAKAAAEARQALISELLEWCHGQRNIDHDSLDAKLRELERVK